MCGKCVPCGTMVFVQKSLVTTLDGTVQIKANANRVYIEVSYTPSNDNVAATIHDGFAMRTQADNNVHTVGVGSEGHPTVRLALDTHGQLVMEGFGFVGNGTNPPTVLHVVEGIRMAGGGE